MTMHIETLAAKDTAVTYLLPGQTFGDDEIYSSDGIGIQLTADEAVVITGEPGAIRSLAVKIMRATVLAEVAAGDKRKAELEKAAKIDERKARKESRAAGKATGKPGGKAKSNATTPTAPVAFSG